MTRQITSFLLRGAIGCLLICGGIAWSDARGLFDAPTNSNPHQIKRWASLKNLHASDHNVDVLVLGNSHAYTGINPKHLSAQLGMTAFVMANNSMSWTDSYWTLREALKYCKPQVVVLETYGLDNNAPENRGTSVLVNQIRAFKNRSDIPLKIASTLDLFTLDEVGMAWSPSIRNHHYLWDDPERLKENWDRGTPEPELEFDDFYLGRFVRFTSGLTPETLAKYDSIPAPVRGDLQQVHPDNIEAGKKIAALCEEAGIHLMFVTVPMYHRHVAEEQVWAETLQNAITEIGDIPWLNLQADSSYTHNPNYFENTTSVNQHMTHIGSIAAAKDIGMAIENQWGERLVRSADDPQWLAQFAECEGFFAYRLPTDSMDNCAVLGRDLQAPDFKVEDVLLFTNEVNKGELKTLQFRLKTPSNRAFKAGQKLRTQWAVRVGDNPAQSGVVECVYSPELSHDSIQIFRSFIKPEVTLLQLMAASL